MKKFTPVVFSTVLLVLLTGCSYFDKDDGAASGAPVQAEKIDLTAGGSGDGFDQSPNLPDMIRQTTRGGVDYYPVDGDVVDDAVPVEKMTPVVSGRYNGTTYSMDPSVEVFPLDDEMARALPQKIVPALPRPPAPEAYSVAPLAADAEEFPPVVSQTGAEAVIYFDRGETRLDADNERMVAGLAASGRTAGNLKVEGHASTESSLQDPVRRKIVNLKVSMDRALSVARSLIENGVPAEAITTTAHGETRPAATADQSRRVDITGLTAR